MSLSCLPMEAARPRKLLAASGVKGIWYSVIHGGRLRAAHSGTAPSSRGSLSILPLVSQQGSIQRACGNGLAVLPQMLRYILL